MDKLHSVMRAITPQTKAAPDHMTVFREFLANLGRIQKKPPRRKATVRRKRTSK